MEVVVVRTTLKTAERKNGFISPNIMVVEQRFEAVGIKCIKK